MSTGIKPTAADKIRLARNPPPFEHEGVGPDVGLGAIKLQGRKLSARVENSITSAEIERTMQGASRVSLTVRDQSGELLRSGLFNKGVTLQIDRLFFRLVQVRKVNEDLQLTFEDREVAWLRKYRKPRKVLRDKMTRAQFVRSLVREVKEGPIGFYAPELTVRQPIEKSTERPTLQQKDLIRQPGLNYDFPNSGFTVKGQAADAEQTEILNRSLDVARSLGAQPLAELALIVALIQESSARNLNYGHSSSVGPLQLLDIHLGGSTALQGGRRDVELVVNLFLTKGFTGKGGAIYNAALHPDWSPARIAAQVQGNANGAPDYVPWEREARAIVLAYDPNSPRLTDSSITESTPVSKVEAATARYEFSRGKPGEPEDSWTTIQRLAREVNWRAFMVAGTLFFISEQDLFASRPRMRINERSRGVDWINFDWDVGKKAARATITCRAELWSAPPGSVVVLEESGPANGRWLVERSRRSLTSTAMAIELTKPTPALPEPAAETGSTTGDAPDPYASGIEPYSGQNSVADVKLDNRWGGTQAIFEQVITPFILRYQISPGSQKRTYNTVSGGYSDHYIKAQNAYAIDYPTTNGEQAARDLAHKLGFTAWEPNSYTRFDALFGGKAFSVQILWGAEIDHADHIHVGVRA